MHTYISRRALNAFPFLALWSWFSEGWTTTQPWSVSHLIWFGAMASHVVPGKYTTRVVKGGFPMSTLKW